MYKMLTIDNYQEKQEELNISSLLAKVLVAKNISNEEYYQLINVHEIKSPDNFIDMKKAVERIKLAIKNSEKIMIYGDYDCDGISATSILVLTLKELGVNPGYYIPNRYKDGYGINTEKVNEIFEKGYTVLITVDNGIAQMEALSLAKDLGIDVILTDHHQLINELPPHFALLHPQLSNFSKINCSGAFVAFQLSRALLEKENPYCLILAALSTISDIMPLLEENHNLVKIALNLLNNGKKYPQFEYLSDYVEEYNEMILGSPMASKINAVGRIATNNSVNKVVSFLTADSSYEVQKYYEEILKNNQLRKQIVDDIYQKIEKDFLASNAKIEVIILENVIEGVIGLIATKLAFKFNKTILILVEDSNDPEIYKGSGRSNGAVDLTELFNFNKDLLKKFGGHKMAGGFTIIKENIPKFQKNIINFSEVVKEVESVEEIIEISIDEIDYLAVEELKRMEPFGENFEAPLFIIKHLNKSIFNIDKSGKHLLGKLGESKLLGFNLVEKIKDLTYVDLIFRISTSKFKGRSQIELRILDILISQEIHN